MTHTFHFSIRASLLATCGLLASCVPLKTGVVSSRAVEGLPQYWLTTSMYAAPLLEDPKLMQLAPSLPDMTRIVPAGTLVQITGLSSHHGATHKQFWVLLRVAKERGQVSIFSDQTHVVIAPEHITTKSELKSYLNSILSKNDPHVWILPARTYIQEGIWHKQPVIGMSRRELLAAMGPASKRQKQRDPDTDGPQEIWHYPDYLVVLSDQQVSKVKRLSPQAHLATK